MLSEIRNFWQESRGLARFGLLIAAASLLIHVLSLARLGWTQASWLGAAMHLAVMALGFGWIARNATDTIGGLTRERAPRFPMVAPVPRRARLSWLAVALVLYALAWFFGMGQQYGEGWPEERDGRNVWVRNGAVMKDMSAREVRWADARMLSVFSAAWLAFAFPLALAHDRRTRREKLAQSSGTSGARAA